MISVQYLSFVKAFVVFSCIISLVVNFLVWLVVAY